MTTAHRHPDTPGIARYPLDATHSALPRNHHGDPVAPITTDRRPYQLCWTDSDAGELVFAETPDDLLCYWWPTYRAATSDDRARMIAEHAVGVRSVLAAELVVAAEQAGTPVNEKDEAILLAELDQIPDLFTWSSPVPLVLLEGMYRPYTDRRPPISAIDGDVREPSNILWLRNGSAREYVLSLARAGVITLDVYGD